MDEPDKDKLTANLEHTKQTLKEGAWQSLYVFGIVLLIAVVLVVFIIIELITK
jgi:hypothetical protein